MKKWKLFNRLWHWANAFVVFFLIASSLLIESDIAIDAIKYHVLFGYLLTILFIARVVYMLCGFDTFNLNRSELLVEKSVCILKSKMIKDFTKDDRYLLKKAGSKLSYLLIMLILFGVIVTGFLLKFKSDFYLINFYSNIKYMHQVFFYFLSLFTVTHIFGVIYAECTNEPNIVSDMINGGKENSDLNIY